MANKVFDNQRDLIMSNVSKVVLNKAALQDQLPCARALGGHSNVIRAATLGLQNSDLFGLVLAHLVLCRSLGIDPITNKPTGRKSTEQMEEFGAGVASFVEFMAECAKEIKRHDELAMEQHKKQQ